MTDQHLLDILTRISADLDHMHDLLRQIVDRTEQLEWRYRSLDNQLWSLINRPRSAPNRSDQEADQ